MSDRTRANSRAVHHPELPDPHEGVAAWLGRPVWNELRRPMEIRNLRRSALWRGEGMPEGRGRPVLLVPGFLAGKRSADALEHVLTHAGWRAVQAEVGRNAGPAVDAIATMRRGAENLMAETGQRVTIIGHSRGGQFARVLAVQNPELVRQVVAVGSPLRTKYPKYLVVKVPAEVLDKAWRLGAFGWTDPADEDHVDELRYAPFPDEVTLVAVWSRSDGVIDWRLTLDPAAVANIEVVSSHQGLFNGVEGVRGIGKALEYLD